MAFRIRPGRMYGEWVLDGSQRSQIKVPSKTDWGLRQCCKSVRTWKNAARVPLRDSSESSELEETSEWKQIRNDQRNIPIPLSLYLIFVWRERHVTFSHPLLFLALRGLFWSVSLVRTAAMVVTKNGVGLSWLIPLPKSIFGLTSCSKWVAFTCFALCKSEEILFG